jgi:DNA-binding SARP family transcriptional activator/transcriptional regulator with XRE-family HTH domain
MDRKRGRTNGQLGILLRKLRREAGLTQLGLAESSGLSVGMIRDLEQDRTGRPYRWSLERLGRVLRLDDRTIDRLVASEPPPYAVVPAVHADGPPPSSQSAEGLWIQVLGPLGAWRDGVPIPLGGEKQKILLGVLALQPNTWLHRDSLVDAIWGDEPPASAAGLVQTYAARVQRLLGPRVAGRAGTTGSTVGLVHHGTRYRLTAAADQLDLLACENLVAEPLCDIDALRRTAAVDGLHRRWATLVVQYAEACFQRGWYLRPLPPVEELVRRDPLNEHAQACLMVGLAGTGQQAAAMAVYHRVRNELGEQLGILPSQVLSEAYDSILHRRMVPSRRTQLFERFSDLRIA